MHRQISIWMILLISLFAFSGCTETASDGTIRKVGVAQKLGSFIYKPVYSEVQVGTRTVTKDRVVGHKVAKIQQPDGTFVEVKEPVIETVMLEEPVFENVITSYELNTAGKAIKTIGSLVPVPGVDATTGGLLGVGSIALLGLNQLRRKEKKGKVSMEDKFHVLVGGIKDFSKTEEGEKAKKFLYDKLDEKAAEHGIAKEFKSAVKIAKAVL